VLFDVVISRVVELRRDFLVLDLPVVLTLNERAREADEGAGQDQVQDDEDTTNGTHGDQIAP
jgi:hypothetical protein